MLFKSIYFYVSAVQLVHLNANYDVFFSQTHLMKMKMFANAGGVQVA